MNRLLTLGILPAALISLTGCAAPVSSEPAGDNELPIAYSKLWGRDGGLWLQAGRLPDFSYAGYRNGEQPIPDYPVATSVDRFGAKPDDDEDDTAAFLAAIEQTEAGAIHVPAGRYIITNVLRITKPGVVLRGAPDGATTLYFPKPLHEIAPDMSATTGGRPTSNYSWSGGFIRLHGSFRSKVLTPIQEPAERGDRDVVVKDPRALSAGQTVEVFLQDTSENTLAQHLYSDDGGNVSKILGRTKTSLVTRITAIKGNRMTLERRLRCDIRAEWQPVIRAFEPTIHDSGIEDLTFEFPNTPYLGHFTEVGYNPVAFSNAAHCWARRLKIVNADSGPMVGGVFNTVSDLVFTSEREPDRGGARGHHGVSLGNIGDHLLTRFDIRMKFIHDITVSRCAGVVVSQGKGEDLCFDHHKQAPYEILFTDIDLGKGTRPWHSGGGADLGKHAGARVTFWNLRAAGPLPEPTKRFAPWSVTMVGVNMGQPEMVDPFGVWREAVALVDLRPRNLHTSQLTRRLRGGK